MGRVLKRVPTHFNWPLKKVWEGYINPYSGKECKHCERGYNKATQRLFEEWYGYHKCEWVQNPYRPSARYNKYSWNHNLTQEDVNALVEQNRLMDFTHTWSRENGWKEKNPPYVPTAEEVNQWSFQGFGHDSINCHVCVKARAKREGIYGLCSVCHGECIIYESEEARQKHDDWKEYEPPTGDGYQLWENTSEGSPSSPVFSDVNDLAEWCAEHATIFADIKVSKLNWLNMFNTNDFSYNDDNLGAVFI